LIHAIRLGAFSLSSADTWVPRVSPVFPTTPADPGRKSSAPPLPRATAPCLYSPPHHSPPLIPFKPSLNALNGYSPHRYSGHPSRATSPGPIKATPMTPGALHTSPRPSPLLSRARNPPHRVSRDLVMPPPLPGRYAAARAPVRPKPSSPCSSLPFAPPPVSFAAPERPKAELR
jgi:hypothetical protein